MFESISESIRDSVSHIDSGLDMNAQQPFYPLVLVIGYALLASLIVNNAGDIAIYATIAVLFVSKILVFSLVAVQYYAEHIENTTINPFSRITNWEDIFITGTLVSGLIVIGLLLLILPGVYVGYRFGYAIPLVAIHKESPKQSLLNSWSQTSGSIIETISICGLTTLVGGFIGVGLLSSYLLAVDFPYFGPLVGLTFIIHLALFEIALFGGLTSLELDSHADN